jgi:hypothetical protein
MTGFFYVTGKPTKDAGDNMAMFSSSRSPQFSSPRNGTGTAITNAAIDRSGGNSPMDGDVMANRDYQVSGNDNEDKKAAVRPQNPAIPSRNPQRSREKGVMKMAQTVINNPLSANIDDKNSAELTPKPLSVSYQQRYAKARQPVLGPRLTAILLKRELRRVGCYEGNISSNWDENAQKAVEKFNAMAGFKLASNSPEAESLQKIKQISKVICQKNPAAGRTIMAKASVPNAARLVNMKSGRWRSSMSRYRKASARVELLPTTTRSAAISANQRRSPRKYGEENSNNRKTVWRRKKIRGKKYAAAKRSSRLRFAARKKVRRKTAIRGWRKRHRRKRFGFRNRGGSIVFDF